MKSIAKILALTMACLVVGLFCVSAYGALPPAVGQQEEIKNLSVNAVTYRKENHKDTNNTTRPYYCMRSYDVAVTAEEIKYWQENGSLVSQIRSLVKGDVVFYKDASTVIMGLEYSTIDVGALLTADTSTIQPNEYKPFTIILNVFGPGSEGSPDYDSDAWIAAEVYVKGSSGPASSSTTSSPSSTTSTPVTPSSVPQSSEPPVASSTSSAASKPPVVATSSSSSSSSSLPESSSLEESSVSEEPSSLPVQESTQQSQAVVPPNPGQGGSGGLPPATTAVLYSTSGVASVLFAGSLLADIRVLLWYSAKEAKMKTKKV